MISHILSSNFEEVISLNDSKSHLIRMLIISALTTNETKIYFTSKLCDDVITTINVLIQAGIKININNDKSLITVKGDTFIGINPTFNFKDCGAAIRLLLPLLIYKYHTFTCIGSASLIKRMSVTIPSFLSDNKINYLFTDREILINGFFNNLDFHIDMQHTSQLASGTLILLAYLNSGTLTIKNTTSLPYFNYTINTLKQFNYSINQDDNTYKVSSNTSKKELSLTSDSDLSCLAYYILFKLKYNIVINNVRVNPNIPDYVLFDYFKRFRIYIKVVNHEIKVDSKNLCIKPITLNFKDCPDLALPFVGLSIILNCNLTLEGLNNLEIKESNRLDFITKLLDKLGQKYKITNDNYVSLSIYQTLNRDLNNTTLDGQNDHRCIMLLISLSKILNLNWTIINSDKLNKSASNFLDNLNHIGVHLTCQNK